MTPASFTQILCPPPTTPMAIIRRAADVPRCHEQRPFRSAHCPPQEPSPMLTHARAAVAPRRAPPSLSLQPPEPWAALLDCLGTIEDEPNIVVLGRDGPDLMCALLRVGAPQVTHLCSHDHLESDSASLVIVPRVPSLDGLDSALPPSRAGREWPPGGLRRSIARHAATRPPRAGTPRIHRDAHHPRSRPPGVHRRDTHPETAPLRLTGAKSLSDIGGSLTALVTPFRDGGVD